MELRKRALGIAIGLVLGLAVLLGTWWVIIFGASGSIFARLDIFFRGYSVSWGGSFVGLIWGFVFGFITGFVIALFYNMVNKSVSKPKNA